MNQHSIINLQMYASFLPALVKIKFICKLLVDALIDHYFRGLYFDTLLKLRLSKTTCED